MESPRVSGRLASKRKVMEEEGIDVPWKALIKGNKSKNLDAAPPKKDNPSPKKTSIARSKKSNSSSDVVKDRLSGLAKADVTTAVNTTKNSDIPKKDRARPRKLTTLTQQQTLKPKLKVMEEAGSSTSVTDHEDTISVSNDSQNSQKTLINQDLGCSDKLVSDVTNCNNATSAATVDNQDASKESTGGHSKSNLVEITVDREIVAVDEEIGTTQMEECVANEESSSENFSSVELLHDGQTKNEAVCIQSESAAVCDSDSIIAQGNNDQSEISLNSSSTPETPQAPFVNVTVGSAETDVNEVQNEDNETETGTTDGAPSGSDVDSHNPDENLHTEVGVQEFMIEGETSTPVRNALLDIIMKRQQMKEDNNDSLVAATISQEIVPPGTSEQIQDALGEVAMECNVEFMLSDKMVLVYGNWQEVEKARQRLAELRKQRDEEVIEETQQPPTSSEIFQVNAENLDIATTHSGKISVTPSEDCASSEPIELRINDLQEFSGETLEENSIILEVVEPTEEGQKELEESGVHTILDHHKKLVYRKQSVFVKDSQRASYTCSDCGYQSTEQGLAKHRMRFHNDLQHSCIVCGLTFGMRYDMRLHRLSHFDIEGNLLSKAYPIWSAVNPNMEHVHLWELEKGFQVKEKTLRKMKHDQETQDTESPSAYYLSWMKNKIKDDESSQTSGKVTSEGDKEVSEKMAEIAEVAEGGEAIELENFVEFVEGEDCEADGETKVVCIVQRKGQSNAICNICTYMGSIAAVRKHCERQHPIMTFRCPICQTKRGVVNDMQKHLQGHRDFKGPTDSKAIRNLAHCEQCGFSGEAKIVRSHIQAQHGSSQQYTETSQPVPRKYNQSAMRTIQAQGNVALPRDSERFACEICGKEILLSRYKHHMKSHEPGWKCDLCDFSHRNKSALLHHKQKEHNEGFLFCKECDKKFATESSLKFHISGVHNREAARVVCILCNKIFATERFLRVHIKRIHDNVKRYFCDICNKGFYEKVKMLEHRVVHGTEKDKESIKKWQCSFCDRRFRTRFCAKQHENCHTGEKPFNCRQCPKTFAWRSEAQKHEISMHTEGTTFNCHVCGRGFKFQYKLNSHMALHNKVIKNMCQKCGKCFTLASTLRKHNCKPLIPPLVLATCSTQQNEVKDSEEAVEYLCGLCNEAFESVEDIVAHMSEEHDAHSALLSATDTTPNGNQIVAMETEENNVEMMYIPKDEEMIVLGQNSEQDLVVQETIITDAAYYDTQQNSEAQNQRLNNEASGSLDHNYLKGQLLVDDKAITEQELQGNAETVEIIIEDGNISTRNISELPIHAQLVIVDSDSQSSTLQNPTIV